MKKTMIAGGVAAMAMMGVVGGVAVAQQAPAPTEARQAHGDTDGDGRISQAEFVQQRVARLTSADANGDGSVSAEETSAAREAQKAQRASNRFDRMDTNRDGSISRAEFDAQIAARAERGPRAGKGERGERMAARREARGPVVIAEAQTKATEAFSRLDANSDGFVTVEERRAGREQMRESRQERRAERMARRGAQTASPAAPASE